MNKTDYLKLCQKASMYEKQAGGKKPDIPDDCRVMFDGFEYYPDGRFASFEKGRLMFSAVLHGIDTNCQATAPVDRVEPKVKER